MKKAFQNVKNFCSKTAKICSGIWNSIPCKIGRGLYAFINFLLRLILLALILYSAVFTIAASVVLYKGFIYVYDLYESVEVLKDSQPEMSKYMQALKDSSPGIEIKHSFVPLDSISMYLQKAVIASEDAGFYFHPGFDVNAIAEALNANRISGKTKFGGSTITQQLAKNLFLSGERSWNRKFKELAYALLMEHELGKSRILELYLNYAQWGKDIFGCQEACRTYYKKSCSKLSVDQAINLAAMLASPGKHHPNMRESQFMAKRRAVIYQNMFPKKDSVLVDSLRQLMAPLPKLQDSLPRRLSNGALMNSSQGMPQDRQKSQTQDKSRGMKVEPARNVKTQPSKEGKTSSPKDKKAKR